MRPGEAAIWLAVAVSGVLLVASLTGDGRGPYGFDALSHIGWSYVYLMAMAVLLLYAVAFAWSGTDRAGGRHEG